MQEPHVIDHRQAAEVGEKIELSVNIMFDVNSPSETFTYEWKPPKGKMINEDNSKEVLTITHFEYKHKGEYTCVISTKHEPKVSVSAKVTVDFPSK